MYWIGLNHIGHGRRNDSELEENTTEIIPTEKIIIEKKTPQ